MSAADLALLRPWWLAALPLVVALAGVAFRRSGNPGDWGRVVDPALMAHLVRSGRVLGRRRAGGAAAVTAALIALALAGPARERVTRGLRNLDETVIVLDLSRSVAAGGALPAARQAVAAAAEAAGTRAVALVVYAGDAYLALAPTTDREVLGTTLFALDADTVPDRGSHPERGLALARRTLAEAGILAADVVLIGDGGGIGEAALREARAIRAAGWRVQTLFVPPATTPAGAPAPDPAAIERLAGEGGGRAASATAPGSVLDALAAPTARHLAAGGYGVLAYADLGRWLLLVAALPALLLFRRGG